MNEKLNEGYKPDSKLEKGYTPTSVTKKPTPQGGYKPAEGSGDNPVNNPPKKP